MVAVVDASTFGASLWLLIGRLLALGVLLIVIVASWTGIKILLWRWRMRRAAAEDHRRRFRPDGRPYPPAAAGICTMCARAGRKVYHLSDGRRLCPDCYAQAEGPQTAGTGRGGA